MVTAEAVGLLVGVLLLQLGTVSEAHASSVAGEARLVGAGTAQPDAEAGRRAHGGGGAQTAEPIGAAKGAHLGASQVGRGS
jgi:hypothetical protein